MGSNLIHDQITIKDILLRVVPEKMVCDGQVRLLLRLSCEIF